MPQRTPGVACQTFSKTRNARPAAGLARFTTSEPQKVTPATRITLAYGVHSPVRTITRACCVRRLKSSCETA